MPGYRRKGHADEHFWIVLNADMMGGVGPLVIEDELSHAVELEIHRAAGNQLSRAFDYQMVRQPAGFLVDAAGLFQALQPMPLEERRAVAEQCIPLLPANFTNFSDNLYREID